VLLSDECLDVCVINSRVTICCVIICRYIFVGGAKFAWQLQRQQTAILRRRCNYYQASLVTTTNTQTCLLTYETFHRKPVDIKLQALEQCIPPPRHVLPVSRYGSASGSVIRITTKIWSLVQWLIANLPWKFHANPFGSFCANRQTDKQRTTITRPSWRR